MVVGDEAMAITIPSRNTATLDGQPAERIDGLWWLPDEHRWAGFFEARRLERAHAKVYGELTRATLRPHSK